MSKLTELALKSFKNKKEQKPEKYTSFHDDGNYLYEQVFNGQTSKFARYDQRSKKIDYVDSIDKDDFTIKPIMDEEVSKKAVLLPSRAEDYGTEEQLDTEIKTFTGKWLDIPEDFSIFALWNIKRSWIFEKFHTLNYLRALGDTGQGKSRFLDTLGGLHYKPIFGSGAATSAPIFRIIDKWRGTLILDEADLKVTDETIEIIKIINLGYEKGKHVMRCDQNDATKILFFDPFCPKVLATRREFTDKATESRCITQVMTGTRRKDISFTLTKEFHEESLKLRNKLLTWRFHNLRKEINKTALQIDFGDLEPRVQQVVGGYLELFAHDSKQLDKFKAFVRSYQEELISERENTIEGQIVRSLYDLYNTQKAQHISAQDIINNGNILDYKGETIKPRALASILKQLGFNKAEPKRIYDKIKRCIPLDPLHLADLFKRYGCNDVTIVTIHRGTGETEKIDFDQSEEVLERVSPPPHIQRNNRNTVTELGIADNTSNPTWEDLQEMLHENGAMQIERLLDLGFSTSFIEKCKQDGLIYEARWGVVQLR